MGKHKARTRLPGSVRVIGGELRGRRVPISDHPALRPTPDRVRETLFNWLAPRIAGATCLDLFAGTGVLGIEALSRGASWAEFVEADPVLAQALGERLRTLTLAPRTAIRAARAEDYLATRPAMRFDLVFLDPPYALPLAPLLESLQRVLAPGGLVYVERPTAVGVPESGHGFRVAKRAAAGRLSFGLLEAADDP